VEVKTAWLPATIDKKAGIKNLTDKGKTVERQ